MLRGASKQPNAPADVHVATYAELERAKRGAAKFDYSLAAGRADLFPEQCITVSAFKPD